MIEAELPDGTILEFPAGTPDDVIDRTVRAQLGAPAPQGGAGAWLGRRARDVIEGVASFPAAAADAMFPGLAVGRQAAGVPGLMDYARGTANAIGLPAPQTDGERMTSAVVQGAIGAIPTMGVGATGIIGRGVNALSQGIGGATGGAAAEAVRQAGYGEAAQTAAGLVGGLGGAGAVQGVAAGVRGVGSAVAPFTQRGREGVVADTLLRSSTDPANLAQRIDDGVAAADRRLPGSPVTPAVAARDPGLLRVESSVRQGAMGPEAQAGLAEVGTRRAQTQIAEMDALGDGRTAGERGAAVRGERGRPGQAGSGLAGAQQARQQAVSRAYEAIDPDGTSRLPMAPVQAAVQREMATRWGEGADVMPDPLRRMFDELDAAGDVQSWAYMQRVRSRAAGIAGNPANDVAVQASAARVRDAIDATAEAASVPVQRAGAAPTLADLDRQDAAQGAAARPDVAAVLGDMRTATADGRAGGVSLAQFVRQRGGFRERPGEVSDGARMPGLFNRNGLPIDRAMQAAIDAGYYPGRTIQADNVAPGATLTRAEFLRDIGEDVNGRARIFPEQRRAAREDVAGRDALRNEVERELDAQGVGLRDDPNRVYAAARPVDEAAPPAPMDRPDGTIVIPENQRFTPEQAQRWRDATALRRRLGEDFERDTTGANASGRILAQADYGMPRIADEAVPNAALANVSSVRQVLRASNDDPAVRQGLQGQFMDMMAQRATGAAEVVDQAGTPTRVTSPAGFRRFWDQNRAVARTLFDTQEYRRLELLARDFSEVSIGANTGATRNSQTVQNMTVGQMIARVSGGLLDGETAFGATVSRPIRWIYREPERLTRELMGQAMADPRLAAMLLARASPNSVQRATAYIEQNMMGRLGDAAGTAATRQAFRTGAEEQRRQSQPSQ